MKIAREHLIWISFKLGRRDDIRKEESRVEEGKLRRWMDSPTRESGRRRRRQHSFWSSCSCIPLHTCMWLSTHPPLLDTKATGDDRRSMEKKRDTEEGREARSNRSVSTDNDERTHRGLLLPAASFSNLSAASQTDRRTHATIPPSPPPPPPLHCSNLYFDC